MNIVDISHNKEKGEARITISMETQPQCADQEGELLIVDRRWKIIGGKLLGENGIPPYDLMEVRAGPVFGTGGWSYYENQQYQLSFKQNGSGGYAI